MEFLLNEKMIKVDGGNSFDYGFLIEFCDLDDNYKVFEIVQDFNVFFEEVKKVLCKIDFYVVFVFFGLYML